MEIKLLNSQDFEAPNISAPDAASVHAWILSADETDNLHNEAHRKVRRILSHYTDIPEQDLVFKTASHGKPYLSDLPDGKTLYFNLSHSGRCMALAVSSSSPVGIDIEDMARHTDFGRLAARFFHPSEADFINQLEHAEKKEAFLRLWTIKEAFLKGLGDGLTISPSSFSACMRDDNSFGIIPSDKALTETYASWRLTRIPAPDGYICTAAYQDS